MGGEMNGIRASYVIRSVLSYAGYENVTWGSLGSRNIMNTAKAVIKGLKKQMLPEQRAAEEGITLEELEKRDKREYYLKRNKPFKEFKWMKGYQPNIIHPRLA